MIGSTLSADIVRVLYEEISGEEMSPVRRGIEGENESNGKGAGLYDSSNGRTLYGGDDAAFQEKGEPASTVFCIFFYCVSNCMDTQDRFSSSPSCSV